MLCERERPIREVVAGSQLPGISQWVARTLDDNNENVPAGHGPLAQPGAAVAHPAADSVKGGMMPPLHDQPCPSEIEPQRPIPSYAAWHFARDRASLTFKDDEHRVSEPNHPLDSPRTRVDAGDGVNGWEDQLTPLPEVEANAAREVVASISPDDPPSDEGWGRHSRSPCRPSSPSPSTSTPMRSGDWSAAGPIRSAARRTSRPWPSSRSRGRRSADQPASC
ncbi:MAG: hypothetical protein JWN86_467 [Planctomycetota bacterium]|nr:hypothetical protein [Planctomycetota bacterium]